MIRLSGRAGREGEGSVRDLSDPIIIISDNSDIELSGYLWLLRDDIGMDFLGRGEFSW